MVGLLLYRDPVSDCRPDCIVVMCRLRLKDAAYRGGMLGEMSCITQYERCSLLAVKNSHKTVGCFLHFINGPADDLQYRCGVKILLHHGRKHEGEQDARKFLAAELLSKCIWPDLFVPGQHPGQRI